MLAVYGLELGVSGFRVEGGGSASEFIWVLVKGCNLSCIHRDLW